MLESDIYDIFLSCKTKIKCSHFMLTDNCNSVTSYQIDSEILCQQYLSFSAKDLVASNTKEKQITQNYMTLTYPMLSIAD